MRMRMPFTSTGKIALGWAFIISAGLGSFVVARNLVVGNRRECMSTRQRIQDEIQREADEAYAHSQLKAE